MPTDLIQRRIRETANRVGRAGRGVSWLRGAWALAAAGGLAILADRLVPLPVRARAVLAVTWVAGWLVAAGWGMFVSARLRRRSAEFFASLLERYGHVRHNALLNAVQFRRQLATAGAGTVSAPLLNAEIEHGFHAAENTTAAACVDRAPMRRHGGVLFIIIAAIGATVLMWPDVWAATLPRFYDPSGDHPPWCPTQFTIRHEANTPDGQAYYGDGVRVHVSMAGAIPDEAWIEVQRPEGPQRVEMFRRSDTEWFARFERLHDDLVLRAHVPRGYSKLYRVALVPIPRIAHAAVRYQPPAYTGLAPYETAIEPAGIEALRDTQVTLAITANRPLSGGEIRRTRPDGSVTTLPMTPDPARAAVAAGTLTLDEPGSLTATVTSTEGYVSRDRVEAKFTPIDDAAPTVEIEDPVGDAMLVAGTALPIQIRATDDVTVANVQLHVGVNGRWSEPIDLPTRPKNGTIVHVPHHLDPTTLGAKPGDVIEYFATAADNYPSPHRTDSPIQRLSIISHDDYAERLRHDADAKWLSDQYDPLVNEHAELARKLEALAREARSLMEQLAKVDPNGALAGDLRQQLEALAAHDAALRQQAGSLAERMEQLAARPPIYDVQKQLNEQLQAMARDLRDTAGRQGSRQLSEALQRPNLTAGQAARAVERVLTDLKKDQAGTCGAGCRGAGRQITQSLETLEQVYELMALTEEFKAMADAQKDLADKLRRLEGKSEYNDEDQKDLERYGAQEREIEQSMKQWTEQMREKGAAVREFAEKLESTARSRAAAPAASQPAAAQAPATQSAEEQKAMMDRAARLKKFAGKADELAATAERIGIRQDMDQASQLLSAYYGSAGAVRARRAIEKMKSMIKQCNSAGGAASDCLSLDIVEFGDSLSQLRQSMSMAGATPGQGNIGTGQGGLALPGSNTPIYGPYPTTGGQDKPTDPPRHPYRLVASDDPSRAPAIETITPDAPVVIDVGPVPGETVPANYKELTEAYFKRLAEDNR